MKGIPICKHIPTQIKVSQVKELSIKLISNERTDSLMSVDMDNIEDIEILRTVKVR